MSDVDIADMARARARAREINDSERSICPIEPCRSVIGFPSFRLFPVYFDPASDFFPVNGKFRVNFNSRRKSRLDSLYVFSFLLCSARFCPSARERKRVPARVCVRMNVELRLRVTLGVHNRPPMRREQQTVKI